MRIFKSKPSNNIELSKEVEEKLREDVVKARESHPTLIMLERLSHPKVQEKIRAVIEETRGSRTVSTESIMKRINEKIEKERSVTHFDPKRKIVDSAMHGNSYFTGDSKVVIGTEEWDGASDIVTKKSLPVVEAHEKHHSVFVEMLPQIDSGFEARLSANMKKV